MNRKEISHLAIDLIEELLEKPNQTIVLEQRINKPVCEQGAKEPTEGDLELLRAKIMKTVYEISGAKPYKEYLKICSESEPFGYFFEINYTNDSRIILKEEK